MGNASTSCKPQCECETATPCRSRTGPDGGDVVGNVSGSRFTEDVIPAAPTMPEVEEDAEALAQKVQSPSGGVSIGLMHGDSFPQVMPTSPSERMPQSPEGRMPPTPTGRSPTLTLSMERGANAQASIFNGTWTDESQPGKFWSTIKDGTVMWSAGQETAIEVTGSNSFVTKLNGTIYSACLDRTWLRWDFGGVWIRKEPQEVKCPNCKNVYREDLHFCRKCGRRQVEVKHSDAKLGMHPPDEGAGGSTRSMYRPPTLKDLGPTEADLEDRPEMEVADVGPGARYTGQWWGTSRYGRGILVRADGSRYEGSFIENQAHGRGLYTLADGGSYDGEWVQGHAHGYGRYQHTDGGMYTGEWFADEKSGRGTEKWADGTTYKGEFLRGKKHGAGLYTSSRGNGSTEYNGQFRDDKMDGHGVYKGNDGRVYTGQWSRGHKSGQGKMVWANGSWYEGAYEVDLKHGVGTFSWPDGRVYKGQWRKGRQDGVGTAMDSKGSTTRGEWRAGRMVSNGDGQNGGRTSLTSEPIPEGGALDTSRPVSLDTVEGIRGASKTSAVSEQAQGVLLRAPTKPLW